VLRTAKATVLRTAKATALRAADATEQEMSAFHPDPVLLLLLRNATRPLRDRPTDRGRGFKDSVPLARTAV